MSTDKAGAANLLAPGDRVVAVDRDAGSSGTAPAPAPAGQQYPNAEGPTNLIDYDPTDPTFAAIYTKYLNFGKEGGGVIVTANNAAVAKKIGFITANDATERDPMTFRLYGTNSPIVSANNSGGTAEPWTLIYSGNTNIGSSGPNFPYYADISSNNASYKSYKLLLTSLRNGATANSMQLAEMQLYTDLNGDFQDRGGTDRILANGNPIISIDGYQSNHPSAEVAPNVVDGTNAKYLNFGKQNSGFVVTPSRGSSVAHSFRITTAGDAVARDPSSIEIWGTNGSLLEIDNGNGDDNTWTLIYSGTFTLPDARNTAGDLIGFDNNTAYTQYKILFPTVKDANNNSMQLAEFELSDTIVPVPEPAGATLLAAGLVGLGSRRCRRRA